MAEMTRHRTCVQCGRTLLVERFYRSGHGNGRRRTCRDCLVEQAGAQRRAEGRRVRHPRYNSRGDVWCNRCQRYRPSLDFKPHPSRPGKYWSYCKPCVRDIDRERYARRTATVAGAERELSKRYERKQRQRRKEDRERRRFVADSILLLRRRGLTKAEICKLADVSFGSLLDWERQARRVTPAVEDRFAVVLRETAYMPAQDAPVHRRRLPHPDLERLLTCCRPRVQAIPVRTRWKGRTP